MKMPSSGAAAGSILFLALMAPAASGQSEGLKRKTIDESMKQLARDKDPEVRATAARRLGTLKVAEAVPLLTSALADAAPPVRANAAAALWKLAPASRPAVPALEKALADASPVVRLNAAGALNALDAGTPASLIGVLGALLNDALQGKNAAQVLVSMDLENADVRRAVLDGLARGEVDVRKAIVEGMFKAGLSSEAALPYAPALAQAIRADKSADVRMGALWVTQAISPLPKDLAAAIEGALNDESPDVRRAAALVLKRPLP